MEVATNDVPRDLEQGLVSQAISAQVEITTQEADRNKQDEEVEGTPGVTDQGSSITSEVSDAEQSSRTPLSTPPISISRGGP